MTDKEKIRKEFKKRKDSCPKIILDLRSEVNIAYYDGKETAYDEVVSFIDSMKEEPVIKVWHDAEEAPEMYRKYLARYSDGRINGSWERHDDGFIPWKDVVKEHKITHWCYVEDLLKIM